MKSKEWLDYYKEKLNEQVVTFRPNGFEIIKRDLDVLEIIKNKKVNMIIFMGSDTLEEYNRHPLTFNHLTETEFSLIKEYLDAQERTSEN